MAIAGADGAFERPAGFDPRDAFPPDAKRFGVDATPTVADGRGARSTPTAPALVERELGARPRVRRDPSGAVVVEVPCVNAGAFRSWVLGLVDHAEVLAPPAVRADVVEWLRAMAGAGPSTPSRAAPSSRRSGADRSAPRTGCGACW